MPVQRSQNIESDSRPRHPSGGAPSPLGLSQTLRGLILDEPCRPNSWPKPRHQAPCSRSSVYPSELSSPNQARPDSSPGAPISMSANPHRCERAHPHGCQPVWELPNGVKTPKDMLSWSFSLFVGLPSSNWKGGVAVLHPLVALSPSSHLVQTGSSASSYRIRGVCRVPFPGASCRPP